MKTFLSPVIIIAWLFILLPKALQAQSGDPFY